MMMMKSDTALGVMFFAGVASLAWSATVAWVYWLKHRYDAPPSASRDLVESDRLAQLEATVDALTIEMERVSEAQRFTVRLLDERLPQAPKSLNPAAGRVITPH